jgi:hypothetical protein
MRQVQPQEARRPVTQHFCCGETAMPMKNLVHPGRIVRSGCLEPPGSVTACAKVTPEQINHARMLIDQGEARQYVADLLNGGCSTLYRPLAVDE